MSQEVSLEPRALTRSHQTQQRRPAARLTKLQETCGRLAEMAHELGPGIKLPTFLQLRERLGVSVVTLSAALSELESQRIIERKHGVGIYVSPRIRRRNIALICDPSFFRAPGSSPFWNLLIDKVRERAEQEERGEAIWLHFTVDSLERPEVESGRELLNDGLADDIAAGRVDGVLGVGLKNAIAQWMERHQVPLVAFAGPGRCNVSVDATAVMRLGVTELIRQGCQRIAFWAQTAPYRRGIPGEGRTVGDIERLNAYQEILRAHGLAYDEAQVRDNRHLLLKEGYHTESHQEQGFRTAMETFGPGTDPQNWPDGIFSSDDMLTQGALAALHKLDLRAGRDVKIATHANVGSPALLGWEDDLLLIQIDPSEIVAHMVRMLEECMDGNTPAERAIRVRPRLRTPVDTAAAPDT